MNNELIKRDGIAGKIYLIRGLQVMLDSDLAALYGVETKVFNQAVKRNIERFPNEFRFQLDEEEYASLRSQNATSGLRSQIVTLNEPPKQGVFFDGQIFDAYVFAAKLIRKAKTSIELIDNYVDESVLTLLSKRKKAVSARIYTKGISKQLQLDLEKHNAQYPPVDVISFGDAHDRFLILDGKEVYHLGASLKDLGKKWFAFSKMDQAGLKVIDKINSHWPAGDAK